MYVYFHQSVTDKTALDVDRESSKNSMHLLLLFVSPHCSLLLLLLMNRRKINPTPGFAATETCD